MAGTSRRRLAAVIVADVVGYSRLVGTDEAGTVAAVNGRWESILKPLVRENGGRIVKFLGDGALMEFPSAVDAVRAALLLQEHMSEENRRRADAPPVQLRIGVNLGDVIYEDDDIFGDDVNIAARLEALALPGELCVSQSVYDAVLGKISFASDDLGQVELKNISKPIKAFRLRHGERVTGSNAAASASDNMSGIPKHDFIGEAMSENILTDLAPFRNSRATGRKSSFAYDDKSTQVENIQCDLTTADVFEGSAQDAGDKGRTVEKVQRFLPPNEPTLLTVQLFPFRTVGPNPIGVPLDEGLFEDITANLTRYRDLEVIQMSPGSLAAKVTYADGYALNGTVQYSKEAVRVTVTLIENASFRAIWSERWDRTLDDVFAIQADIADGVVNSLAGYNVLLLTAAERAERKPPATRSAYELYLLGRSHNNRFNREDAAIALEYFQSAIRLDPDFSRAWLGIAWSHDQLSSFAIDTEENDAAFLAAARRAVDLDPVDAEAYVALGEALGNVGEMEAAEKALDRALLLGPGNADVLAMFAGWAPRFGRLREGELAADKARRLNPRWSTWYNNSFRKVYFFSQRFEDALSCVTRKPPRSRSLDDLVYAACCSAALGRAEQADRWRAEAMAMGYASAESYLAFAGITLPEQKDLFFRLLKLAGFGD